MYADVDGFTACVQEVEEKDDEGVKGLVRDLHMIRHEFHSIVNQDFGDLVVQHQGDCMFAIIHLPSGDDEKEANRRRRKAVDTAIGIISSMEHVLIARLGKAKGIHVAVGIDGGRALVTRLGQKGKREVVCLGRAVTSAQDLQQVSAAKQIRIAEGVYEALSDQSIKEEFTLDRGSYVATGLTFPKLDEKQDEEEARAGNLTAKAAETHVVVGSGGQAQSKPWSSF